MDQTIRICKLVLALCLVSGSALAAPETGVEADLYWKAQRAELRGQGAVALKSYNRLLVKLPQSQVAVDRMFETAIAHGDLKSALKSARAQQLADSLDPSTPLVFYVDAWRRKDWAEARAATLSLKDRGVFGFLAPLLDSWVAAEQGGVATISNATLRDNGMLAYYADDQLVYFDLANGNLDSAKRRLSAFPGFGENHERHMALTAIEHLANNGQSEFSNALLQHIGLEPAPAIVSAGKFSGEQAIAALFARLSVQLEEQGVQTQALYFARLASWIAPESAFAHMTLAGQMQLRGRNADALILLDGVSDDRPQWSWVLGDKAQVLSGQGRNDEALRLIRTARIKKPQANDLRVLEAQQLTVNGDLAAAADVYRTLIADADGVAGKNGRRVTYRMLLAQTLNAQHDWPEIRKTLEEALAINGSNPQLLNTLGYGLLERREDIKRGFELVAKAYSLASQSPAITDSLGWGHYLNGEYAKAVPLLEKAVEGAINDVTINEHLGDAYWQVGRAIEARYAWKASILQAEGEAAKRIATKLDLGWTEATAAR